VTQQQGQFSYVEAKDINDIISGIQVVALPGHLAGHRHVLQLARLRSSITA
jgi:hypothetical protein